MPHFNGTEFRLHIDGSPDVQFDAESELSFDITAATIDTTSKDSEGWATNLYGLRAGSGSATLIVDFQEATKKQYKDIFAAIKNRTHLTFVVKKATEAVGDFSLTFSAKIDSLGIAAPMEDKVTSNFSFTMSGAPTEATAVS
jgi:hypothetical protein